MATQKSSGKKSSGKKTSSSAGNSPAKANAALLAVSKDASAVDSKESVILQCLVQCFFANGLPALSPSAKIVWNTIADNILVIIGDCVRDCINSKGFQSIGWAGPFLNLKSQNKVTVVSALVTAMANMVEP